MSWRRVEELEMEDQEATDDDDDVGAFNEMKKTNRRQSVVTVSWTIRRIDVKWSGDNGGSSRE